MHTAEGWTILAGGESWDEVSVEAEEGGKERRVDNTGRGRKLHEVSVEEEMGKERELLPFSTYTDRPTDGLTDGHTLIWSRFVATKMAEPRKEIRNIE